MDEYQKNEMMAEASRMKQEMIKIVYGSGYRITQHSGRILTINNFTQHLTYSGMMEGLPTRKDNDARISYTQDIKGHVLHAPRLFGEFGKYLPPDSSIARRCAVDPYEVLPGVNCVARVISEPCENHVWNDIDPPASSTLTIVWFQNGWAMPIDPDVLEKLKTFDWDAHAVNQGPF